MSALSGSANGNLGALTIVFALLSIWLLPDYPRTTKWLSEEERAYAEWRLAKDIAGEVDEADTVSLKKATLMAFADHRVWFFVVMQHCNLLSQTFTYFFPTIVASLGYSNTITLLLTAPPWLAAFLASLLVTWNAGRVGERAWHVVVPMLLAMIGNIIVRLLDIITNQSRARRNMFLDHNGNLNGAQILCDGTLPLNFSSNERIDEPGSI